MKKKIIILMLLISLVMFSGTVIALSKEQTNEIRECKKNFTDYKKQTQDDILLNFKECKENCKNHEKKEISNCISACSEVKKSSLDLLKFRLTNYQNNCKYKTINPNVKCENFNVGEVFLDGCNICRCDSNGKISCKLTQYCNYNDVNIDENYCINNNGLYLQLCNGPYFDIVCSKKKFCLCGGLNDYSCPSDYDCVTNFLVSINRRDNTIKGWKTLLGENLGDIGICAKKTALVSCGNGICENILTPDSTAETKYNCPIDCT
jgi:hypothetical protein